MSVPQLEQRAGVYHLTWKDEQIVARVDRLHTERAGVYGELLLRTTIPAGPSHLHGPVHFNFISTSARAQLVRHLHTVIEANWTALLEQTCYLVVEGHRKGNPAIHIPDHTMPDALGMRINPIIAEKQPTLFFGEGDSLKSFFATYVAVITCLGIPHAGLTPEPGRVLYLDYETDIDTFWERVHLITTGLDKPLPEGLFYRHMVEPVAAEFPRLNTIVSEQDISLVVVDSAAPATLEPENAEVVTSFFASLRALGPTSLVIAHMTKVAKGDYPFGSSFWRHLPRSNFHIRADRNQDDVAIVLRHTKSNNGKRLQPLGFKFHFEPDSVTVERVSPADYDDLKDTLPVWQRIAIALKNGQMDSRAIAEEIGISDNNVRAVLSRYQDQHFVKMGNQWGRLLKP